MIKIYKNKFFVLGIIILIASAYFGYKKFISKENQNTFTLVKVRKGSIEKTVSGSGNIVSVDTFDIKSKVSGKITYLPFKEGDWIRKGELLIRLDTNDIEKQIRDLEFNLESQKINLEKLIQKKEQLQRGDEIRKINESYFNIISGFIEKFPSAYDSLNKIYFNNDFSKESNIRDNLEYYLSYYSSESRYQSEKIKNDLNNLKDKYLKLSSKFNSLKAEPLQIDQSFIKDLYNLTSDYLSLIKFVLDKIRTINENSLLSQQQHIYQSIITNHLNQLTELYSNFLVDLNNFGDYINKTNAFYDNLNNLELDIKNAQVNIKQLEVKIQDLKDELKDYEIYSPVSGYISQLNAKINDYINPSVTLLIIQSTDKIAEIKLNEVDLAEIKIGNDAILTFDALPNLRLKGKVVYINPIGEVSQGVVSYKVKIAFENNPEIRIGMTVNADIVIKSKKDALIIPNQALKMIKEKKYVEVPNEKDLIVLSKLFSNLEERPINVNLNYPPQLKFIKTGLSDEKYTEVLEGLEEGDWIIVKSQSNNQQISVNQEQGLFQRFFPQPRRFIRSPGIRQ